MTFKTHLRGFFQPEKKLEQMCDMKENTEVKLVQQLMFIFTCIIIDFH